MCVTVATATTAPPMSCLSLQAPNALSFFQTFAHKNNYIGHQNIALNRVHFLFYILTLICCWLLALSFVQNGLWHSLVLTVALPLAQSPIFCAHPHWLTLFVIENQSWIHKNQWINRSGVKIPNRNYKQKQQSSDIILMFQLKQSMTATAPALIEMY